MPFQKGNQLGRLNKGKKRSEEFRKKLSQKYLGSGNPFYGKHHSLELRKSIGERSKDEKAHNWKGDKVGYAALHIWVKRRLRKPIVCQICKTKKPYDLANISQRYKRDVSDWEWLCRKCHIRQDGRFLNYGGRVSRLCLFCNKEFMTYRSQVKRGGGNYCSRSCSQRMYLKKRYSILDK